MTDILLLFLMFVLVAIVGDTLVVGIVTVLISVRVPILLVVLILSVVL